MGEVIDINHKIFEKRHKYFIHRRNKFIDDLAKDISATPNRWKRKHIETSLNTLIATVEDESKVAKAISTFMREDIKVSLLSRFGLQTEEDIDKYKEMFEDFKKAISKKEVLDYEKPL